MREEAADAIRQLKEAGITKVVMMTGDSERTAAVIAKRVGVDEYYSEVLPEDKASFIQRERENGAKTIMVGDGINDSPALSAANVGIAISDGAELAREIADITIGADNLYELVTLKKLSNRLMKRIDSNYRSIVGINSGLIGAACLGSSADNIGYVPQHLHAGNHVEQHEKSFAGAGAAAGRRTLPGSVTG